MEKPVFVATYGSLRRNMSNHGVNNRAGGELVGLGNTVEDFSLYAYCTSFPSVSLKHPTSKIRVEVYETTENGLRGAYDRLEGYYGEGEERNFYDRSEIEVLMDDGSVIKAWIYHIDEEQSVPVKHGDWAIYKNGDNYYDTL